MGAGSSVASVLTNAGPWFGVSGGVAAWAAIPHPEMKFFACAALFALAAGSLLRRMFFADPAARQPADYPFSTYTSNPWDRDGGPHGL